ncbi:hypothetical protein VTO73DRAFT_15191 [Trametes versicolor]
MAPRHIKDRRCTHRSTLTSPPHRASSPSSLKHRTRDLAHHSTRPSIHHARIIYCLHSREPGRERAPDFDDFESTVAAHIPGRHPRDRSDSHTRVLLGRASTSAAAARAAPRPTRSPRGPPPPHIPCPSHPHVRPPLRRPRPPQHHHRASQTCSRVHPRYGSTRSAS